MASVPEYIYILLGLAFTTTVLAGVFAFGRKLNKLKMDRDKSKHLAMIFIVISTVFCAILLVLLPHAAEQSMSFNTITAAEAAAGFFLD